MRSFRNLPLRWKQISHLKNPGQSLMNTDSFELELDDEELELELSHGSDTCCSLGIAPFVLHMQLRFEQ